MIALSDSKEITGPKYTLKSELGQLETVKRDAKGRIIDGHHRKDVDPNWREEIVPQIDTDVKFFAAQIAYNFDRRVVEDKELKLMVGSLVDAIRREENIPPIKIPSRIEVLTGLSPYMVRKYMPEDRDLGLLPRQKPEAPIHPMDRIRNKETAKPREPEPETEALKEEAPQEAEIEYDPTRTQRAGLAQRGTRQFEDQIQDNILTWIGEPLSSITNRLMATFQLTEEESREHIEMIKRSLGDASWNRVYDSNGNPKTIPRMQPVPPNTPPPQPKTQPQPPLTYQSDPLYDRALDYYPEKMLDAVWDLVAIPSKKIPFMKNLVEYLWTHARRTLTIEEIINAVIGKQ